MIDEAAQWHRFAALLPSVDAQGVTDCWDMGEQEAGLRLLITGLLRHQLPISETTRAEIAVTAEIWGMWTALAPEISRCPSSQRGESSLSLIESADTAPVSGPLSNRILGHQEMPIFGYCR